MSTEPERWLPVPGWAGYEVSDQGRVRSRQRTLPDGRTAGGVVRRASPDRKGYLRVHLRNGRQSSTKKVHVLVAEAFHGRRPQGMQILHRGDDKSRNGAADIRYGTRKQNDRDRKRRGRRKGRTNRNRKGKAGPYRESPVAAPVAPPVTSGDAP
jgi:hypothetical protein